MDDAIFTARQIEILYYGDYKKRMKVKLFTNSEPNILNTVDYMTLGNRFIKEAQRSIHKTKLVLSHNMKYSYIDSSKSIGQTLLIYVSDKFPSSLFFYVLWS